MILQIPTISSTNKWLREQAQQLELPHGFAVRADYQTAGHGQQNNAWESEQSKNLLFSLLIHPTPIELHEQFIISQIVSLAIAKSIQSFISPLVEIKWPNDIYVEGKKICGILIENSILGNTWSHCIVGVGINVNQTEFLSDAPNPTSIKLICGDELNIGEFAELTIKNILDEMGDFQHSDKHIIKEKYMSILYQRVGYHKYEISATGTQISARITDVSTNGLISLEEQDKEAMQYAFKEIKFLR